MEHDIDAMNELWQRIAPRPDYEEPMETLNAMPFMPQEEPFPVWQVTAVNPNTAAVINPNTNISINPTANINANISINTNVWEKVLGAADTPIPVCFGSASPETAETIRELYAHEMHEMMLFEHLASQNRRTAGKLCHKLMLHQKRLTRRLDTVFYLLTGKRCGGVHGGPDMNGNSIRQRYRTMAMSAIGYKELAGKTDDHCLRDLFLDTAKKKTEGSQLLLEHLEEGHM